MLIFPKSICRFNSIPWKYQEILAVKLEKLILKFIWEFKGPRIAKTLLEKKVGGLALLDFETNYISTVIRLFGKDARTNLQVEQNKECRRGPIHILRIGADQLRRGTVVVGGGDALLRAGSGTIGYSCWKKKKHKLYP